MPLPPPGEPIICPPARAACARSRGAGAGFSPASRAASTSTAARRLTDRVPPPVATSPSAHADLGIPPTISVAANAAAIHRLDPMAPLPRELFREQTRYRRENRIKRGGQHLTDESVQPSVPSPSCLSCPSCRSCPKCP